MKKIEEGKYLYKGIIVYKLSNGNYIADVPVNAFKLPLTIMGATQAGFKKIFTRVIEENGGLRK